MIEALLQRVEEKASQATISPISFIDELYFWSRMVDGTTNYPGFDKVKDKYENASIVFSFKEIDALTEEAFLNLQRRLRDGLTVAFAQLGQPLPDQMARLLVPGTPRNVFIHEREHLSILPDALRESAEIHIFIMTTRHGNPWLNGAPWYDMKRATDYDNALLCSEPQSLSEPDILQARNYAQKTGDSSFIALVEQRIGERLTH